MDTIGWGILGCGHIAGKFATDLQRVAGARLVSSWRRDTPLAEGFAREHGGRAARSRQELLEDPGVQVVYVATPHHLHLADILDCLKAGKHVLCEKPLGMDSSDAAAILQEAKEKGLFVMEALWTRFLPHFQEADRLVRTGRIGAVGLMEADFGFKAPYRMDSRLFAPESGGTLWDIGIYPLFLARHFLGEPGRIVALADHAPTGVDQRLSMGLSFPTAHARLFSSFLEWTACAAILHGTEGTLRLEGQFHAPTDLVLIDLDGNEERIEFPREGFGYQHEIAHVQECLRGGLVESPLWSHADTLGLLGLMDRVREAAGLRTR